LTPPGYLGRDLSVLFGCGQVLLLALLSHLAGLVLVTHAMTVNYKT
jgi:hypothetical protein